METIVGLQNGQGVALADTPEYRRAQEHLPDELQVLAFVDLQRIIAQIDPDSAGMDEDDYEILKETFGAIAIGENAGAGYSRTVLALTLFPE